MRASKRSQSSWIGGTGAAEAGAGLVWVVVCPRSDGSPGRPAGFWGGASGERFVPTGLAAGGGGAGLGAALFVGVAPGGFAWLEGADWRGAAEAPPPPESGPGRDGDAGG